MWMKLKSSIVLTLISMLFMGSLAAQTVVIEGTPEGQKGVLLVFKH